MVRELPVGLVAEPFGELVANLSAGVERTSERVRVVGSHLPHGAVPPTERRGIPAVDHRLATWSVESPIR